MGFDAYWNLLVAKRWASSGFPNAMPEAAFTSLASHFADRQIGFHAWLRIWGAGSTGLAAVPPLVWASVLLQALSLFLAIRILRPGASPLWILLPAGLSATWLFRSTALRDLPLAIGPLLVYTALILARLRGRSIAWPFLSMTALCFVYLHAAWSLLLFVLFMALLGQVALDPECRPIRKRVLSRATLVVVGASLLGLLIALLLRPDFPEILDVSATLNLRMPLMALTGELGILPSEYAPYGVSMLFRWEWASLVGFGILGILWLRKRVDPRLGSLVLALLLLSILSRRLFEVSAVFLVLALADSVRARLHPAWLLAVLLAFTFHFGIVTRSCEAQRHNEMRTLGETLRKEAKAGELVFLTDWGLTAPLAWFTDPAGLRFTGVSDPSLLARSRPDLHAAWLSIKRAEDPNPLKTIRERFGARFLLIDAADSYPGRPAGQTSSYLFRAVQEAAALGEEVANFRAGRYICWILPRG